MKEIVVITGFNSALAKETKKILENRYTVYSLTHNKKHINNKNVFYWNPINNIIDESVLLSCQHIVHLAGYSILKKWNRKNKNLMYKSRVNAAELIFSKCNELKIRPKTFISASAIGIYGLNAQGIKNENDKPGEDWVAKMAIDWESASKKFEKLGSRCIQMRISLLFSKKSGFLKYTMISMKLGFGAIIGNPNREIYWIDIKDTAKFIKESIENIKFQGAYNLATNTPYKQIDLFKNIKNQLYKYSIILHIPKKIIQIIIGDRIKIITSSIKIDNKKLLDSGFKFDSKKIDDLLIK